MCASKPHTCACNMYSISRFVTGSSGGLIIMIHTSPYLFCPPSSFRYNSHTLKSVSVLAYFMRILNSCVVYKFQTVKPGCPPSQPYTFSTRLLFDETFAQPDIFAVVNRAPIAGFLHPYLGFFESIRVSRFNYEKSG